MSKLMRNFIFRIYKAVGRRKVEPKVDTKEEKGKFNLITALMTNPKKEDPLDMLKLLEKDKANIGSLCDLTLGAEKAKTTTITKPETSSKSVIKNKKLRTCRKRRRQWLVKTRKKQQRMK